MAGAFRDQGFVEIKPDRLDVGDIFTARNLISGAATGVSIISGVGGKFGASRIIFCETESPGPARPRMKIVEERMGFMDEVLALRYGLSPADVLRACIFCRYPFVS